MAKRAPTRSAADLTQLALRHHRSGHRELAERALRAALVQDAAWLPALAMLSGLLLQRRDDSGAVELLQRAIALSPSTATLHSNLAEALRRLGRHDEALTACRRALVENPELVEAHYNHGLVLEQLGFLEQACGAYEAALGFRPELALVAVTLLWALRRLGQYARGIAWYERLWQRWPDSAALRGVVGNLLADAFRVDEATIHLRQALQLEPRSATAHADLARAVLERGEVDDALALLHRARQLEPENPLHHSNLVYALPFSENTSPGQILDEARAFGRRYADALEKPAAHANVRAAERRLRVGYVSPDFRQHPVAQFMLPLLVAHDREQVEVCCYSNVAVPDAVTQACRAHADSWRDIAPLDDQRAAALIREDRVDVLVDLAMHSSRQRLLLFGLKPAPVQVCWLAYPGTTGIAAMDYRLTDARLDPPSLGEPLASEASRWLPHSFWCYAPSADAPEVNELPALRQGYVTFGSLNSFKKVSGVTLTLWAKILRAAPGSRLLMIAPQGVARARVHAAMATEGVEASRVELLAHSSHADYLKAYQRIDIALDPVPYGGGTTSLDALWMGVPLVSLVGSTCMSRAGASILHTLQLDEWSATTADGYVRCAVNGALELQRVAALRRGLRERMLRSPLTDQASFARDLEAAYRSMWRRWCGVN